MLTFNMAGNLTPSKCFSLTFNLLVLLGFLAANASSAFGDEELLGNFGYEGEESAYPNQFEETRSAEPGEEGDLRNHELQYQWRQYPSYGKRNRYGHYQQYYPVRPQPNYGTCRDAPQCKACKAPKVPSYQPSARSVRVETRAWEYQFDEDSAHAEYELRYYVTRYPYPKPSLPQCNKECKVDIPKVPVKKPYFNPAAQYSPPGYGGYGR
ncbi:uncharacterized protein LOC130698092 isoform X2 [Daphnia carinata]|uniref:uncharacterized protein LOC130698092 isoform X2 n=1 Tax=Daphnia carinata TaxID=120202 RepID=UPI0028684E54|nr:uncharacterized protein LOC130698092 isoform X2 [Daphnia carinata]